MINILGINVNNTSEKEINKVIKNYLSSKKNHFITTPNPEIILKALKDEEFFSILNKADLSLPDGIGIKIASWLLGENIKRYTGVQFLENLLKIATPETKIAVINRKDGLSADKSIKKILNKKFIDVLVINADKKIKDFPEKIIDFKPDVLFCTFGAPYQEKFIYKNYKKITGLKIAIGIGGAFDYLLGSTKRAPFILRYLGLEWLYRLIFHKGKNKADRKKRLKRIYKAVFIFSKKFLRWRFIRPFQYRKNVACFLYKKENNKKYVLLLERADERNHWQLPQGGLDKDSLEDAGKRELEEEIGTDKFKKIAIYPNLRKYKFPKNNIHRGTVYNKRVGYKGQAQGLFIAEFLGNDKDIKIKDYEHSDWRWVEIEKSLNIIHPVRKDGFKVFLKKFKQIDLS
jgi:N-acetylglucosaminyldiphosphoundecaprenol N-acetyl-beta-D-mannosaminyltransferase